MSCNNYHLAYTVSGATISSENLTMNINQSLTMPTNANGIVGMNPDTSIFTWINASLYMMLNLTKYSTQCGFIGYGQSMVITWMLSKVVMIVNFGTSA